MAGNFVQLHNHTHYSLLDGASKVPDLVKRVKELGMPAVGITDHGNMHGAYELWRAAVDSGVKPIIGIEAYVTPETARQDKTRVSWDTNWTPVPGHARNRDDVSGGGLITHLTMWAENDEGLVNLIKASSVANLEGRVMRYPRMDKEVLATYSKGVIASSGCPSGIIQTRLRLGQFDEALRAAGEFQDIFGKDNFYIELMDHGLSIESKVTGDLLTIGIPALRIISLSFLFAGYSIVCSSVFQALGHGVLSLLVSVVRQLMVLLPVAFLLSRASGLAAVWWAFPTAELFSLTLSTVFLRRVYLREIKFLASRSSRTQH